MASWSVAATLSRDCPGCVIVPTGVANINKTDFWDDTNKRWLSGYVTSTITNITWTGTETSGERLFMVIAPPVYNPLCNLRTVYDVAVGNEAWGGSTYKNITAVNYGMPGPSASVKPDGTCTFTTVGLQLTKDSSTQLTSSITVTVAGAVTFTALSPYASISGATHVELDLVDGFNAKTYLDSGYPGAWGQATLAALSGYGAVQCQLTSLKTNRFLGKRPSGTQPTVGISNPGVQQLVNLTVPVVPEAQKDVTFPQNQSLPTSYVYAVNANQVDANAVNLASPGGNIYHLFSAGVNLARGTTETVAAAVKYDIKSTTGL